MKGLGRCSFGISNLIHKRISYFSTVQRIAENNLLNGLPAYDWKEIEDSKNPNSKFSYYLPACPSGTVRVYLQIKAPLIRTPYFSLKAIPWPEGADVKDKKYDIPLDKYRISFLAFKEQAGKLKIKRSQICRRARAAATITFPLYAPLGCDYLIMLNAKAHKADWSLFLNAMENALIEVEKELRDFKLEGPKELLSLTTEENQNINFLLNEL